jgi:5-methylcytosine-specific restriction endonuclease McrA
MSEKLRQFIRKRANYHCEYCKRSEEVQGDIFHIDHIIPRSAGGETDETNLCLACDLCNSSKYQFQTGIDPETKEEVPLFNPRTQKWSAHFKLSDDFTEIVALTITGRATINRLKINRDYVVKARTGWRRGGWNPPTD